MPKPGKRAHVTVGELNLAFTGLELDADGFESLRLVVSSRGTTASEQLFEDVGEVHAFFDDVLLAAEMLGLDPAAVLAFQQEIRLSFEWTSSAPSTGFSLGIMAVVPEPGTGALLALGLCPLARERRRRP